MAAPTAVTYRPHERGSADQKSNRSALLDLYRDTPIPAEQLLINFGLYTRSGPVAKLLFLNELYEQIVRVPGDIIEFGTW